MKSSLFLLIILTINLASCLNKPDHSPLHEYELVIDSIIEGYDSKDIEVYKSAQYRIAKSFILYDIIGDSLLSSKDKDYLATKLDQAEATWYKHDDKTFFKTTFITDEGKVVEQVNIQYTGSDETGSIAILQVWMTGEVNDVYLALANWEVDSIHDAYSLNTVLQEHGCFTSRLNHNELQVLLERNTLFINGYCVGDDSPCLQVAIPLSFLHEKLANH